MLTLVFGSILSAVSGNTPVQSVVSHHSNQIEWQLNTPQDDGIKFTDSGMEFPDWNNTISESGLSIPVLSKLIYTKNGPPGIETRVINPEYISHPVQFIPVQEMAKGVDKSISTQGIHSTQMVNLKLIDDTPDYQLWAVNVHGAIFNELSQSWEIPDQIQVFITTDLASDLMTGTNNIYLNKIRHSTPFQALSNNSGYGEGIFKISLLQDGIYRIYYDSLAQEDGFSASFISSRSIKLRNKGQEQPIYIHDGGDGEFDEGDYFDFIGHQNFFSGSSQYFDPFSDINVYWVDWGGDNGLRFVDESGALNESNPVRPTTFWDIQHIEEDNDFERLGQVDTDLPSITRDHYFWESVNSGVTKEVQFSLPDPFRGSSENVEITIGLHGLTYSETPGETSGHTIYAFLNDNSIGDGSWTQQEEYELSSPSALNLSHNILATAGDNTLAIFAPVSTEPGNYDKVVLNWIEIGYEHLLKANNDALRFRKSDINPSTNLEFEVKGFSSPELIIYKEGLSRITGYSIRENWDATNPDYSLVFQDQCSDATPDYWVASSEGLLQPLDIVADTVASLREQDGDFIIIAVPGFMDGLEEYLQFKEEEGWNPIAVSIADIYDEFNSGISSPLAIKSFLRYANNQWPSHPEFVLFLGDAIANPQQAKRDVHIRNVPTFYMQTYGWGAAEADYWYSLINGEDYLPDLKIGRIPCSDPEDLEISLNKLIRYGNGGNYGAWQNEIITIAGFDPVFKTQTQSLLKNAIPKTVMPSRIFIDRDSEGQIFWGDTDSLITQWNAGKLLINFLGHGGGAVWADRSLFVRDDINYLDPQVPPAFITSMTCFTASFAQTRGLGEVVLTESPSGAIGWFGSSGVGWIINDFLMIQPMLRQLLETRATVGEIINTARMEYFLANSGYDYLKPSMLFQYNYLGDPTTRLVLPEISNELESASPIYSAADQIDLRYRGEPEGNIKILPIDADGQPWWTQPHQYNTGDLRQYIFSQPEISAIGEGRAIFTLDRGLESPALSGYAPYSISSDWFEHTPPTAADLSESTRIPLRVRFHSESVSIDSMIISYTGSNQGVYQMEKVGEWWSFTPPSEMFAGSGTTSYSFSGFSNGTHIQRSPSFRLYLPDAIALSLNDITIGAAGNMCGFILEYSLEGTPQVLAILELESFASNYTQSISKSVNLMGGDGTLFIPSLFGDDSVTVQSSLLNNQDNTPGDNSVTTFLVPDFFQILPDIGLSFDGVNSDSLKLWSDDNFTVSASDSTWIHVAPYTNELSTLPGVTLFKDSTLYLIETNTSEISIQISSDRSVFVKPLSLQSWQAPTTSAQGFEFNTTGIFATGVRQNYTGPDVSMMIEGQLFFDGDYMLDNSRIDLIAEDENGFAWFDGHVEILVDGSPTEIQLGDTTKGGLILSVSSVLELSEGEHQISYRVADALGNWSERVDLTSVVSSDAEIIDYGNFPNPFEGETLIIYELTQPLDDIAIEIFTLSGYKLHSIDAFNARVGIPLGAIGYHEVPWNGRDRDEKFVANGMYFYRIRGNSEGQELLGPVGKMVKNR